MSTNYFPNYVYGACEVAGAAGVTVWTRQGIRDGALTRVSPGVYDIILDPGANQYEHVPKLTFRGEGASILTYVVQFVNTQLLRVRTFAAGAPFDTDFYLELNRLRTGDLSTPPPAPSPAPSNQDVSGDLATFAANYGNDQNIRDAAMSGFMFLTLDTPGDTIAAAVLNAALAGTVVRSFQAQLLTTPDSLNPHTWYSGIPTLTPGVVSADVDILPPTIIGVPAFSRGIVTVALVMDTDAGVTKTYAPGDTITCIVAIDGLAPDSLLGYPIVAQTKTYTVV